MGGSSKVTVGYRYYMGLHFGLCYGPVDALTRILVGEREAWSGEQTQSGTIYINSPNLFGGDDREGGVRGPAAVMMGEQDQGVNAYLSDVLGSSGGQIPAYRGICSVVFNGPSSGADIVGYQTFGVEPKPIYSPRGQITANNPYVKPWAFELKRIKKGWNDGGQTASSVTEYANGVLYEWEKGGTDPRACENDHQYRLIGHTPGNSSSPGFTTPTSFGTLADAIAAANAQIQSHVDGAGLALVESVVSYQAINSDGATLNPNLIVDPDYEAWNLIYSYFTVASVKNFPAGPFLPAGEAKTKAIYDLIDLDTPTLISGYDENGVQVTAMNVTLYTKTMTATSPGDGWTLAFAASIGTDRPHTVWLANVLQIQVRRTVRAPDNPCLPSCADPYPADPNSENFCIIDGAVTANAAYSVAAGTFKALSLYSLDTAPNPDEVSRYPRGPVLPSTDANYSSEAYWTAAYNAAVTAGTMPSGLTYSASGSGGVGTYPRTTASAYSRTYSTASTGGDGWYPEKADINGDMNAAHIVYQCVTDPSWGMGYPVSQIDDEVFTAVADRLYDESFGLSLIWNQQSTIEEFIGLVMDHIGGVFYTDPATGKFAVKLIRDDYSLSDLAEFSPSNVVSLESFQRVGYGDTTNEVTVVFRDRQTAKDSSITVQDLANVQAQGAVVSQTRQYPGISNAALAARVAMRDLISSSTPLAKARIKVNRAGWNLIPGDVLSFTWPKLGLDGVVFRVLSVDAGTLTDGQITVEMAEDVFGLPDSSYSEQEPGAWEEPDTTAGVITLQDALEAPYWTIARTFDAGDLAVVDPDSAYVATLAGRNSSSWNSYRLWSRVGTANYAAQQTQSFAPTATISGALSKTDTELTLASPIDFNQVVPGMLAQIGTGADAEFVEVTEASQYYGTVSVARGVLDTTPQEHADGVRIWFTDDALGLDRTERATGETVDIKLTVVATGGEGDLDGATALQVTAAQRFYRPYPPGNFTISGQTYPAELEGVRVALAWAHRDRLQQTAELIHQDEDSIGPETGTTYTVRIYDADDALVRTVSGLTDPEWNYGDEYYADVVSLLHGNGVDGGSTITDEKVTTVNNLGLTTSTDQSLFNGSSIRCPGTGSARAQVLLYSYPRLGRGYDMTLDVAIRPDPLVGGVRAIVGTNDGAYTFGWLLGLDAANRVTFKGWNGSGEVIDLTSDSEISTSSFSRIRVTRRGGGWTIFIDGQVEASGAESAEIGGTIGEIGGYFIAWDQDDFAFERLFTGYIAELRITDNVARSTAAYTVDAAAFPDENLQLTDGPLQDLTIKVASVRDGVESWQDQEQTFTRWGLGFHLGDSLGGTIP